MMQYLTLSNVHLTFRPPGSLALAQARQHIVSHLQSLGWQVFTLDMADIHTLGDSAVGIHADWSKKCRMKIVLALYFLSDPGPIIVYPCQ